MPIVYCLFMCSKCVCSCDSHTNACQGDVIESIQNEPKQNETHKKTFNLHTVTRSNYTCNIYVRIHSIPLHLCYCKSCTTTIFYFYYTTMYCFKQFRFCACFPFSFEFICRRLLLSLHNHIEMCVSLSIST